MPRQPLAQDTVLEGGLGRKGLCDDKFKRFEEALCFGKICCARLGADAGKFRCGNTEHALPKSDLLAQFRHQFLGASGVESNLRGERSD